MITTGVTGGRWRASITEWGAVQPWDDGPLLDWHIAADDRWHSPGVEVANGTDVRQRRLEGSAVVETRVRIPDGEAVQRIFSVPDHGGLTVIEVENASPLPIAVAFTRSDLLTMLPPAAQVAGIELPSDSIVLPVGHHSTVTVALSHTSPRAGTLPTVLPPCAGVARGWVAAADRAGRLLVPESAMRERVVSARCELLLCGPPMPDEDPIGFLLVVGQLVRTGDPAAPWVLDVAQALESAARAGDRSWRFVAALDAADVVLARADERRARRDLAAMRERLLPEFVEVPSVESLASFDDVDFLAGLETLLVVARSDHAELFPAGLPEQWVRESLEVYGLPGGAGCTVSFAMRWHGERPAVLFEQSLASGTEPVVLTSPVLAPDWWSRDVKGEALWGIPEGFEVVPAPPKPGVTTRVTLQAPRRS